MDLVLCIPAGTLWSCPNFSSIPVHDRCPPHIIYPHALRRSWVGHLTTWESPRRAAAIACGGVLGHTWQSAGTHMVECWDTHGRVLGLTWRWMARVRCMGRWMARVRCMGHGMACVQCMGREMKALRHENVSGMRGVQGLVSAHHLWCMWLAMCDA